MNFRLSSLSIAIILCITALIALSGCASIGTPSGGPRDETPPKFLYAHPTPGSINVNPKKIQLEFDEYVSVKDAFQNVTISPTSSKTPRVSAVGKHITVQFQDTLQPNTTYTIDFGNAIEDNNESNALQGFTYTFATGPKLDTLRISGMVLGARDLEPQQGMLVGVHTSIADSAFATLRLERVARTDDYGRFTIRGLKPGKYRLFALKDINNDFRWDNPEEDIAFYDYEISPTSTPTEITDTIYNHTTTLPDTVVTLTSTLYLPNNILLSAFNVEYKPQYLTNKLRQDSTRLLLTFNAPSEQMPTIKLIDHNYSSTTDWSITEKSIHNDSITLWLRPELLSTDTLRLSVNYMRNLKRGVWQECTDTIAFITQKQPRQKPKKGANTPPTPTVEIKGSTSTQEYNRPYMLTLGTPPELIDTNSIHLEQKRDTLWIPLQTPALQRADTLNPRLYQIDYPWQYGSTYRLRLDTLAVTDIYGHPSRPQEFTFKVRDRSEYATITFVTSGVENESTFIELLDASDKIKRTAPVLNGRAIFEYLLPSTYYARLVHDKNGNGVYDTGDYDLRLQPEAVSYYPKKITLKKNWDMELTWSVDAIPLNNQKPQALKKNKPKKKHNTESEQPVEEEEEYFDPTVNPFDPNSKPRRPR